MLKLKTYQDSDYYSENGEYITTPQIDSCFELTIAVHVFLVIFSLGMIFVSF